ncbi:PadR family transcriptional regulator [Natronorubrum aibiense]|uniref:PadR family transcriptional regulator n=1 Tax=Natronorubrum aibiense TaxID=348826 RepID=A0A5P9P944_9EURY|nr:PadR family transcriptional regulator [Natronorubrum aibiense]QFU84659.1 hypothetical protein GCU68_19210 [Natronorubrum aibiense]
MEQRQLASLGVLGVLAEEETATMNRIHEKLRHSFGRYWGASTGILMPTISQLEDDGHVTSVRDGDEYGYEITSAGHERLQTLLSEPVDDISNPTFHSHLFLKLGFLHHLPTAAQHDELNALQAQLFEARDRLRTLEARHEDESSSSNATGYRSQLLDLRVRIIDAFLEWLAAVQSMTE